MGGELLAEACVPLPENEATAGLITASAIVSCDAVLGSRIVAESDAGVVLQSTGVAGQHGEACAHACWCVGVAYV